MAYSLCMCARIAHFLTVQKNVNVSMSDELVGLCDQIARVRRFPTTSGLIQQLIREEYERRHGPMLIEPATPVEPSAKTEPPAQTQPLADLSAELGSAGKHLRGLGGQIPASDKPRRKGRRPGSGGSATA